MTVVENSAAIRPAAAPGYTRTAIALHWILVAVIFTQIGLGWYMTDLPQGLDRSWFFGLHKSFGLTAALLIFARLAWRLTHRAPPMPLSLPSWQALAARINHFLLYACMILMPAAGYVSSEFYKDPTRFWGYSLPHWGWENETINGFFSGLHTYTSYLFVFLIAIHVAAALKHARRRDGVFSRMLP